jgi:ribosome-associated translation inhibitor RaiA
MHITITARHCEIPEELRARARALVERLAKVATRPHDGQVLFSEDHGMPSVEVRVHAARAVAHVATAGGADHRSALDLAVARVRRQLGKAAPKRRRVAAARRAGQREAR